MSPRIPVTAVTLVLAAVVPATAASARPVVATTQAQNVTQTGATLTGTVNPRGDATKVYFRYGTTRGYGARTAEVDVGSGNARVPVRVPVTELQPGTRYHFRLVAVGEDAPRGANRSFKTTAAPKPPPPPPVPEPSKLQLSRATIYPAAQVIDILAPITRRASGSVSIDLHAAGRHHRWTAPIDSTHRRIRQSASIPAAQAAKRTGILTIHYPGNALTRPQTVRLRAANVPSALTSQRPTLVDGRLRASGTVSQAARGKVRVQLEYFSGGVTTTLEKWAPIVNGTWQLDAPLAPEQLAAIAQRRGTVHSYVLFTGYYPAKMRGEMRSFEVLGAPKPGPAVPGR